MLTTVPSKYGKPGDVMLRTPIGILSFASLDRPDTSMDPRGVWSCGLQLDPSDLAAIETVLRDASRAACPSTSGPATLPIRADKHGVKHLFAKSTLRPKLIDLDGSLMRTIPNGMRVVLMVRACPWSASGRFGVSVYLNAVRRASGMSADLPEIITHSLARPHRSLTTRTRNAA